VAAVTDPQVVNNTAVGRFEAGIGGALAELVYRAVGDRLILVHTEVPAELEGHGMGGLLVAAAVDHAASRGLTIVPLCPFARTWLERHPDAAGRVTIDWSPVG
jgi:predicted GNAT family acetyltransferase